MTRGIVGAQVKRLQDFLRHFHFIHDIRRQRHAHRVADPFVKQDSKSHRREHTAPTSSGPTP